MHTVLSLSITSHIRCLCYVTCFYRKILGVPIVNTVLFWLDNLTFAYLVICLRHLCHGKPLSNFVYISPDIEYIHQSQKIGHSMHIHTNSVFSLAQPPQPLWLTKVASAASVGINIQGDRGCRRWTCVSSCFPFS